MRICASMCVYELVIRWRAFASWQSLTIALRFYPATLCCWDFLADTSEPRPQLASIVMHNDCGVSDAFTPCMGP